MQGASSLFLGSIMNRLGLKIGCLLAALVIWMQVAHTSTVEQDIYLPLRITGLQPGLTYAGSRVPARVPVRVLGRKLTLLRHRFFNYFVGEVRIDVSGQKPGPEFSYEIKSGDIFTNLDAASAYPPTTVHLRIDRLDSLMLPVRLQLENSLPADRGLLSPVATEPESVLVTGPGRFFDPEPVVMSRPVDLSKVDASLDREVGLTVDRPLLEIRPDKVQLAIRVGVLEDRTLANVPVVALVDAGRPEVGVSPPVADVKVRGVADSLRVLTRDRLLVTIPVGDRPVGVYSLPGQVDYPPWLTLLGLVPPRFQVIVGNPPVQEGAQPDSAGRSDGGE